MVERVQLSREIIIARAHSMIVEHGLDAVSLRGVAAALGVTAPALYAYVDDKLDMLRGVAESEFERLLASFETIEAESPLELVRLQAHAYVRYALADPALFQMIFLFRPDFVPQPNVDELPAATRAFASGASSVEAAMADGSLRAGDPMLVSLALWAATHGAASMLLAQLNLGPEYESQILATVIDNLVRGLAVPLDSSTIHES